MANLFSQSNQGSKTLPPNIQNFLESLRSRSGSSSVNPQEIPTSPFAEIERRRQIENKRIEQFQTARQKEWQSVYSAKEKAIAKQIEEIREQLKKLASQLSEKTASLDKQVITAVNQPITDPGIYQLTFLDHIKSLLELVRQDVSDANNWLASYKNRCQKKGFYWQQTDKQGSSFFLNNERSVATSVG